MANIMSQVKLQNHTSRNGFDLSNRNAFSAKIGELLPVCCTEVIPGDTHDLSIEHFTRTMPVNTAAYTRIREYFDWFFVPTDLLWNKFGSFITQMTDNNQHATSINERVVLSDGHPYFTCSQIFNYFQRLMADDSNNINLFNYRRSDLSAKLLEYLDYGNFAGYVVPNGTQPFRENAALNPFPLLAYQKIYQDYFRNSQWEKAYAPAFNIDYMSGAPNTSLQIPIEDMSISNGTENMFDLRYANWHKDLFMGLLPNAQFGSAASVQLSAIGDASIQIKSQAAAPGNAAFIYSTIGQFLASEVDNNPTLTLRKGSIQSILDNSNFAILALRQAEALQKWKEITQSRQQDYKSQVEAHFGVSPDNGYSDMCRWIDGSASNLDISEVTNTNITGDNASNIAGKGVGVGRSKTTFSSKVHGYLICIYHAVPLLDYGISGISRTNLKTKVTDYAIPEFDRTGMVAVPTIELTNNKTTQSLTVNLLGYAPRYYDYKQKIDRVHGAFIGDLSHWVAPVTDAYIRNYLSGKIGSQSIDYSFFKINPATLNPIFARNADSSLASDQLLVNAAFGSNSVRNLDRNGLPY